MCVCLSRKGELKACLDQMLHAKAYRASVTNILCLSTTCIGDVIWDGQHEQWILETESVFITCILLRLSIHIQDNIKSLIHFEAIAWHQTFGIHSSRAQRGPAHLKKTSHFNCQNSIQHNLRTSEFENLRTTYKRQDIDCSTGMAVFIIV